MKFKVALYKSEEGYAANALSLPGCWSQGDTESEALANITDAIREFLDAELPPKDPSAILREVEVA
jgi:predicted RNase H-like HicB family nuclease